MLCQFYIISTNNKYNSAHKNISHVASDKAGYMLQPKPITAAPTNVTLYPTNMKARLYSEKVFRRTRTRHN